MSRFSEAGCRWAAAALLVIEVGGSAEKTECLRALDDATAATAKALSAFESKSGGDVAAARNVLAAAGSARTHLESRKVSAFCEPSRGEELIYLNHLTLGFTGWIAARSRRPPEDYDLVSVIRRARTHRERGRARLR
ncbi:MAG TPA: hypothetical protein VGK86_06675 [Thermoanaerobaculia bacterium]